MLICSVSSYWAFSNWQHLTFVVCAFPSKEIFARIFQSPGPYCSSSSSILVAVGAFSGLFVDGKKGGYIWLWCNHCCKYMLVFHNLHFSYTWFLYYFIFLWLASCVILVDLFFFFFFAPFAIAVFHYPVMHHCYWNQPQPIHLHRKVYSSVIPSAWAHENHPCLNFGILLLWKRRPQFPCSFWDHSSCRYDLVWECFVKTRGKRAPKLCTAHWQITEAWTAFRNKARRQDLT